MNDELVRLFSCDTFPELLQRPFSRGMTRRVEMQNPAGADFHDNEHIDKTERCGHHEEVTCDDRFWHDSARTSSNVGKSFRDASVPSAYSAGPFAGKSECRSSTRARRRSVPRPMSDCSPPFQRSASEPRRAPADDRQVGTSISRTTQILSDASGSAYRVSPLSAHRDIRRIDKVGPG